MKLFLESLINVLKPLINLGEVQSKRSPNFKIITITFPTLLHGSDFVCNFLFDNF